MSQIVFPAPKERSTTPRLATTWQHYFPPDLTLPSSEVPHQWSPAEQRRVIAHLQAVWRAVQTYLPRRAVHRLLSGLDSGEMWGQMAEGTFLYADISGFTSLADRLSTLPDGTEKLTNLINDYFTTMLNVVAQSSRELRPNLRGFGEPETGEPDDGTPTYDLLKFGGDAMLLLFSGPHHARLALHAAVRMQENMSGIAQEAQALGATSLGMHIGINSGRFLDAHVGTPRVMKKIEVGRTLNLTAMAEEMATSGQIAVGPGTFEAVQEWSTVRPVGDGFYLIDESAQRSIKNDTPVPVPDLAPPDTFDDLIATLDAMVPYLPPGLLEKITLDPHAPVIWADLKPVTVVFANLLGVADVVEAMGQEGVDQVTAILDRYLGAVSEIVARYDGMFNKMDLAREGDKLLILFGAPHAHEDDPQRAVRAALEMQEALRPFTELTTPWGTFTLHQRVGIHSGNVFAGNVGSPARKEYTVMGNAVNLAARLMAAAQPGQIIVSQETRRRLGEGFDCETLSPLRLKGKPDPVPVCQITGLQQEGFVARRTARQSQLVGRRQEMMLLKAAAGRAWGGEGQAISVVGDAGVGKSRLVEELIAHVENLGMGVLRGGCVSYGGAMAYLPWIELLRGFFGWAAEDTTARRQEKLQATLSATDAALIHWAPVVAGVLGLSMPETPLTQALDAKLRKERFFAIVSQILEARASESPLLLVFEDLHWADPISLELLNYVARNLSDSPILLLGARRPDGARPQWDDLPHHQIIHLGELSLEESRELTTSLLRMSSLPPTLETLILDRAQGNPFYVEEVVSVLIDRGDLVPDDGAYRFAGDPSTIEIPETISGVLMSRIDSLDEGSRTTLRVASVIGRIFAYHVLKAIYPRPIGHTALRRRLETLRRLDLTPLEEPEPNLQYIFRHILTQEVAYESLLHARRRDLHGQVALYYETTHRQKGLEEHYDLLAYHFGRSTYRHKALEYTVRAGDRAKAAYANAAAVHHYSAALELLQEQGQAHTLRWANVQFSLAEVYVHVGRYKEAIAGYQRALEVARQGWSVEQRARTLRKVGWTYQLQGQYKEALGWLIQARDVAESDPVAAESRQMARVLSDMGGVYIRQADFTTGINLIDRALELLARLPEDTERVRDEGWAYTALGLAHANQGNTRQAKTFFEKSLKLRGQVGDLVGVATLHNNLGYVAHHLQGDIRAAIESYQHSLSVCHQIGYREMMALASNNLGLAYQASGDHRQAVVHYQTSLQLFQEMGDLHGIASTYDNLGTAYHQQGDYERAMEYHHLSLEIKRQQEAAFQVAASLINIAAVCRDQAYHEEAIGCAEEALAILQEVGGRLYLAEAYTVLAETLLMRREYESARQYASLALETAVETGSLRDQGVAARALGEVEMRIATQEMPDGITPQIAQDRLYQSVELLEEVGDRFELAKSLRSLGRCLTLTGHEADGATYQMRATQIFQDLGAQGELNKSTGWETGVLADDPQL